MYRKFILIAAVCAVLNTFFAGCRENPVWTNVTEDVSGNVAEEPENVTETVTGTGANVEAEASAEADVNAETEANGEAEANAEANTTVETETDTKTDTVSKTETKTDIKTNTDREPDTETGDSTGDSGSIVIYICGAVANPGVYELPAESRVVSAIEAAGGLLEDADPFLVNQARILEDGEQIRILTREEAEQVDPSDYTEGADTGQNNSAAEEKININTADVETLMTLPGIGQAKADAIVEYRKSSGGFQKIEDIMNISGIKEAVFAKIKDKITVS